MLVNVPKLISAYYTESPDPSVPEQRVMFGTSGHRGSALEKSFNEGHILAITQAICLYREQQNIDGPLFLGIDTHALSVPAFRMVIDPVCNMEVNEKKAAATYEYKGKKYYFCAVGCKDRFSKDPEKFLGKEKK